MRYVPARLLQVLPKSFYRFLVGGAANTAITYLVYLALLQVLSYGIAYSLSYAFGIGLAFLINGNFVFRSRLTWLRGLQVVGIYATQYLYGRLVLWGAVELLGVDARLALPVAIITFIPINYVLSRLVFRGTGRPHEPVV